MTPIQTHEAELRAMMERAGIKACDPNESGYYWLVPHSGGHLVLFYDGQSVAADAVIGFGNEERNAIGARHPDPRIALRHCLEMAGLLTDRPPQTDEQLVQWLTERWGEPRREGSDLMESTVDRWSFWGVEYRHHAPRHLRWSDGISLMGADAFGALLWCAERFPEVKP
jgi:hypothetical protein